MICPCRGCADRHEACHDACERYGGWKARRAAAKQAKADDSIAEKALMESHVKRRDAYIKSMRKRGKRIRVRN